MIIMNLNLEDLVHSARNIVVFTGAGMSTESGIPDYRSPGGLWTQVKPIMFDDFLASEDARKETWRRRFENEDPLQTAKPNLGHFAIAQLAKAGKVSTIITQNIDGLHQASGIPEGQVIELHGNATYAKCLECGHRTTLDYVRSQWRQMGTAAPCDKCEGLVKPATISFGQPMPEEPMRLAQEATLASDLFISIGSSLTVYPAAGFPLMARKAGATFVILNRDETELDEYAHLVLNEEIGSTLSALTHALGYEGPDA